jgi:hypothetical protein
VKTPFAGLKVTVAETGKANEKRLYELLAELGAELGTGGSIVFAGLPGGEAVARAARARQATVVLSIAERDDGLLRCRELDADLFVTRPVSRDALAAAVQAAVRIAASRTPAARSTPPVDLFQRMVLVEMKRAQRFGYAISACLVAVDGEPSEEKDRAVVATLQKQVRDVDLPVVLESGRYLVLLPYTTPTAALPVGERIERAVRTSQHATVSVGIAGLPAGARHTSFARLVAHASSALRAAQLKGGAQVVVRQ